MTAVNESLLTPEITALSGKADHLDVKTGDGKATLPEFLSRLFSLPGWVRFFYRIRALLAGVLGLNHPRLVKSTWNPEEIPMTPGALLGGFTVRDTDGKTFWIAETPEDKHLTAFICVTAMSLADGRNRFHVTTIVRYKHWTGRVYFNLIRPFHHLIVGRLTKTAARGA
jgi:hypothetical protein